MLEKHQRPPFALWTECQREYYGYGGKVFLLDFGTVGRMYRALQRRTGGKCLPKLSDLRLLFIFIQCLVASFSARKKEKILRRRILKRAFIKHRR